MPKSNKAPSISSCPLNSSRLPVHSCRCVGVPLAPSPSQNLTSWLLGGRSWLLQRSPEGGAFREGAGLGEAGPGRRSVGLSLAALSWRLVHPSCPQVLRLLNVTYYPKPLPASSPPSPGFPQLEELCLATTAFSFVDNHMLWRILSASSRLRVLDLRGCVRVTPKGLEQLTCPGGYRKLVSPSPVPGPPVSPAP